MKDSVELCQCFGRTRQENSLTVVMDERRDRPVKNLKEVQCRQDDIMETFAPSQAKRDKASEKNAQRNRERGAEKCERTRKNAQMPRWQLLICMLLKPRLG